MLLEVFRNLQVAEPTPENTFFNSSGLILSTQR
jgi:hypothetical protein